MKGNIKALAIIIAVIGLIGLWDEPDTTFEPYEVVHHLKTYKCHPLPNGDAVCYKPHDKKPSAFIEDGVFKTAYNH